MSLQLLLSFCGGRQTFQAIFNYQNHLPEYCMARSHLSAWSVTTVDLGITNVQMKRYGSRSGDPKICSVSLTGRRPDVKFLTDKVATVLSFQTGVWLKPI